MNDTIQKIADDLKALAIHTADHGISGWNGHDKINAIASRLRALSARASAGEGWLVPGVMHCAKCKFRLVRTNLHVNDGTISAGDNKTEPCPNGCGPLWPVTWENEARECWARMEEMSDRLTTAPQPAQAGASGGGEVEIAEIMRGCLSAIEGGRDPRYGFSIGPSIEGIEEAAKRIAALLTTPASPATGDAATWEEEIRRHDATPPARGDGEGDSIDEIVDYLDAVIRGEYGSMALHNSIKRTRDRLSALTTRPTPEAQEARDAVDARRYRYLRDHCKREWYSDMPHNKGAPSLDIEFEARGHDLDAAIDAALALPAQGEGKNG